MLATNHAGIATVIDINTKERRSSPHHHDRKPLRSSVKKHHKAPSKNLHWHPDVIDNRIQHVTGPTQLKDIRNFLRPIPKKITNEKVSPNTSSGNQQLFGPLGKSRKQSSAEKSKEKSSDSIRIHTSPELASGITGWLEGIPSFATTKLIEASQRSKRSMSGSVEANSGRKRDSATVHGSLLAIEPHIESNDRERRVPPAVPDAPSYPAIRHTISDHGASRSAPLYHSNMSRGVRPPPTPRISRLPTPDLPEVEPTELYPCDWAHTTKSSTSKMTDQNAALAHIRGHQRETGPEPRFNHSAGDSSNSTGENRYPA